MHANGKFFEQLGTVFFPFFFFRNFIICICLKITPVCDSTEELAVRKFFLLFDYRLFAKEQIFLSTNSVKITLTKPVLIFFFLISMHSRPVQNRLISIARIVSSWPSSLSNVIRNLTYLTTKLTVSSTKYKMDMLQIPCRTLCKNN